MTASELITRLQQLIAEHGDLEVACFDHEFAAYYPVVADDVQFVSTASRFDDMEGPFIGIDHG